jgi:hypothetical protein
VQAWCVPPVIPVVLVSKWHKHAQLVVSDHHIDAAAHVVVQVEQTVVRAARGYALFRVCVYIYMMRAALQQQR